MPLRAPLLIRMQRGEIEQRRGDDCRRRGIPRRIRDSRIVEIPVRDQVRPGSPQIILGQRLGEIEIFSLAGRLSSANIAIDRPTLPPRPARFITMALEGEAALAL